MEISQFATYWKATSQISSHPNALITGSSLSGDYLRVFVQTTRDGIPVLFPRWAIESNLARFGVKNDLVSRLTYQQLNAIVKASGQPDLAQVLSTAASAYQENPQALAQTLSTCCASLQEVLTLLPPEVHLDIHILYPQRDHEERQQLGPTQNMNSVVDSILAVVFAHAGQLRGSNDGLVRSLVFSSFNADVCIGLNWKQPNCESPNRLLSCSTNTSTDPVLLCNDLGMDGPLSPDTQNPIYSDGRTTTSVKEAVRVATGNNFMGLICSARLLVSPSPLPHETSLTTPGTGPRPQRGSQSRRPRPHLGRDVGRSPAQGPRAQLPRDPRVGRRHARGQRGAAVPGEL